MEAQTTPIDDLSNIFAPIDVHACVNLPFWTSKFRSIVSLDGLPMLVGRCVEMASLTMAIGAD